MLVSSLSFFLLLPLLSLSLSLSIKEWSYLGPFPVGKSEVDGDPLYSFLSPSCSLSSLLSPSPSDGCPKEFASPLAVGGLVRWKRSAKNGPFDVSELRREREREKESSEGMISVMNNDIRWNEILQGTQRLASMEFQGWTSSRILVSKSGFYRFFFSPAHTFFLNFTSPFHGNMYRLSDPTGREDFGISIFLSEGTERFLHELAFSQSFFNERNSFAKHPRAGQAARLHRLESGVPSQPLISLFHP